MFKNKVKRIITHEFNYLLTVLNYSYYLKLSFKM